MESVLSDKIGLLKGKLVSIDIETSGLNPMKHDILEVAAICFDLNPTNVDTRRFHCFLKHDVVRWDEDTFQFHLKNGYFDYVRSEAVRDVQRLDCPTFQEAFKSWLISVGAYDPAVKRGGAATAVGKNFGSFDLQFLNQLNYGAFYDLNLFKHRAIDLGNLIWNPLTDGVTLPSSEKCADRLGFGSANVKHRAMDDAEVMMQMARLMIGKILVAPNN